MMPLTHNEMSHTLVGLLFWLFMKTQKMLTGQTMSNVIPPQIKLLNAHSSSNRWPVTGCNQLNNTTSDWLPAKPYKEPNS